MVACKQREGPWKNTRTWRAGVAPALAQTAARALLIERPPFYLVDVRPSIGAHEKEKSVGQGMKKQKDTVHYVLAVIASQVYSMFVESEASG